MHGAMTKSPRGRAALAAAIATGLLLASGYSAASGSPTGHALASHRDAAVAPPEVRVNQVGYTGSSPKVAFVMLAEPVGTIRFVVENSHCVVWSGSSDDDLGGWNSRYHAVYELTFTPLERPGQYRIKVETSQPVVSPPFLVGTPASLYHQLVLNAVRYYTSERDGADVEQSVLDRMPANLTDRDAYVFADPRYDNNDNLVGTLTRIAGPVDVAGGWFDAGGGYEKFAYTASYTDGLMLIASRDFPGKYPTLEPEAQFGLTWLEHLWDASDKVLYVQVGIGNGNASNSIEGDYNFWFLPQREDHLGAKSGDPDYFVEYRPVFEAAPPGALISPELAGRFAADFALGAQLDARTDPHEAERLLQEARGIYAMAKTTNVGRIVTTFPYNYYPGTEWKSDMLWGAVEIALADEALGASRCTLESDFEVAARWAKAYIAQGHPAGGDTFNLYDNGAIAEAELLQAMQQTGLRPAIAPSALLNDLAAQLIVGEKLAEGDPFALGTDLGPSDATPHAFGLYITNALYEKYGGSTKFQAFAQQQMNFALGANAWGSSFVVGAGTTFPHCMQSEIANLAGSLDGSGDIQLGATGDGPSSPSNFKGLGTVSGMRACSAGDYRPLQHAYSGV